VDSAQRLPLFALHRMHPTNNTKRINQEIRFTLQIYSDGFVGVNFSFEASDHKLNAFGINNAVKSPQRLQETVWHN
jgi:hypothetical protein